MGLNNLKPAKGSTAARKRVGRGPGSGLGKTSGRGEKGQKSRSGFSHREGFEGGQMPLHRRVPKRGLPNRFRKEFAEVNLARLEIFEAGTIVTPDLLLKRGVDQADRATASRSWRRATSPGPDRARPQVQRARPGDDRRRRGQSRGPRGARAMIQSLRNIWDIPDLRKRVLFTLGLLAVYRLGNHIPTPGINAQALDRLLRAEPGPTGSGWWTCSRAATWRRSRSSPSGIMPYISASIILQLLTVVWPYLEKLSQGRRARAPQDHAVHALRHRAPLDRAVPWHRRLPRAHDASPEVHGSSRARGSPSSS